MALSEREMWKRLAEQLEDAVAARPDADQESLTGIYHEVEDPEFLYLLANSLGLSKHDAVDNVMRHPHYPGRNLMCDRYWCESGGRHRPCPSQTDGRCPHFPKPKQPEGP